MAVSLAWARRSAFPPTASMRAGRWASEQLTSYKYVVRGQRPGAALERSRKPLAAAWRQQTAHTAGKRDHVA